MAPSQGVFHGANPECQASQTAAPSNTVSLTVYFHATAPQLLETATGYLLGQARGQAFCNGYFDQAGQLWNAAGHLLATTHQLVYYKE